MRGQNAFVFNLNMIIHIFLHLSNAFSYTFSCICQMLFRLALLEGGAEERLSAGFGRRQPAAASLSAAGPVPESGASSQKWQAAGRQNAAFGQILGAGAFEAAGKPWPTGCGTALPSGQPGRTAPRDSRKGAQIGQKPIQQEHFIVVFFK